MALDREAIYAAIEDRLQNVAGFASPCSRKVVSYTDTPPELQPAIYLMCGNEEAGGDRRQPLVWTLLPKVIVYNRHDAEPDGIPGAIQNRLLQEIEKAFELTGAEAAQFGPFINAGDQPYTTLGGLVASCRIFGTVVKDEGYFQQQGIMEIPLEVVTTA